MRTSSSKSPTIRNVPKEVVLAGVRVSDSVRMVGLVLLTTAILSSRSRDFLPKKMQPTPPESNSRNRYFLRPGMKAVIAGVHHAMVAQSLKRTVDKAFGDDSNLPPKKRTTNMPMLKRNNAIRRSSKEKKKQTTQAVKKTILSMATTYHDQQNDSNLQVFPMTHNTIYTNNITAQVTAGTTNQSRQGDSIYLMGLKVTGNFITATTAGAYRYRCMILTSGEEYNFGAAFGSLGLTNTEIFLPNTGSAVRPSSIVNNKAVTVLYDQQFDVASQIAATSDIVSTEFYVPLKQKFSYQDEGAIFGKTKNIYLVIIGYVAGGSNSVTSTGGGYFNTDLVFKNL